MAGLRSWAQLWTIRSGSCYDLLKRVRLFSFANILQYKRVIWCYRIFAALYRMTLLQVNGLLFKQMCKRLQLIHSLPCTPLSHILLPMFSVCSSSRIFSRRAFSLGVRFFLAICKTSNVVLHIGGFHKVWDSLEWAHLFRQRKTDGYCTNTYFFKGRFAVRVWLWCRNITS